MCKSKIERSEDTPREKLYDLIDSLWEAREDEHSRVKQLEAENARLVKEKEDLLTELENAAVDAVLQRADNTRLMQEASDLRNENSLLVSHIKETERGLEKAKRLIELQDGDLQKAEARLKPIDVCLNKWSKKFEGKTEATLNELAERKYDAWQAIKKAVEP